MPDGTQFSSDALSQAAASTPARPRQTLYERHGAVARIRVEGTLVHRFGFIEPVSGMTGFDGIEQKIDAAIEDDEIEAILLDIDSPGGEVSGCFDLCEVIREARDIKPIWALCDEQCCSAAYALASACTRIVAPATASIGSVGVLCAHVDQSQQLANEGLAVTLIHAGERKVDGNPFQQLPEDVRDRMQADINGLYERFTALVATNRGMSQQAVKSTQAGVFNTEQAIAHGLADAIMPARKVLSALNRSLRGGSRIQPMKDKSTMSIFSRNKSDAAPQGADLETLVTLCGQHDLPALAQPLYEQQASEAHAKAVLADAGDVRNRLAATFTHDMEAGAKLANRFITGIYGSDEPSLGSAVGALMVEACVLMDSGDIDHHQPAEGMAPPSQSDTGHYFEQV
jgi:signal peptide peptidase SppA